MHIKYILLMYEKVLMFHTLENIQQTMYSERQYNSMI